MRLVVIGGGAAGIFCAVNAARMNSFLEVIVLEKTGKLLAKVRISGGGRCNVTHACFEIPEIIKKYPRGGNFVKKAFHHFFTTNTIKWFEERNVPLKTEGDGRIFPVSDSSETIIRCLLNEADKYHVQILMNREVKTVSRQESNWRIELANGEQMDTHFLCIAAGGYPKLQMFNWLQATGHTIQNPVASLFTFNMPGNPINELMGVVVSEAQIKIKGTKFLERGPVLITHWGLSGPAVLRLSAWAARELEACAYRFEIVINWLADHNDQSLRNELQQRRTTNATALVQTKNPFGLPNRLWEFLCGKAGIGKDIRWAELSAVKQNLLVKELVHFESSVQGKTVFKEEFVTAGGVALSEVNASTMESKLHPNLYFAGEILDVDGVTGGFNFQHAWTSAWISARSVAEKATSGDAEISEAK